MTVITALLLVVAPFSSLAAEIRGPRLSALCPICILASRVMKRRDSSVLVTLEIYVLLFVCMCLCMHVYINKWLNVTKFYTYPLYTKCTQTHLHAYMHT